MKIELCEERQMLCSDVIPLEFRGNGHDLQVGYYVSDTDAAPFDIGIYRSADGISRDALLITHRVSNSADLLGDTMHVATINADFTDVQQSYFLIAVVDDADEISENNELNNQWLFDGGLFQATDGTVHVVGTFGDDTVTITDYGSVAIELNGTTYDFGSIAVTGISIRTYDGSDSIAADSSVTLPLWVFAGRGNDTITGGTGDDYLDAGPGFDEVDGGGGSDVIVNASPTLVNPIPNQTADEDDSDLVIDLTNVFDDSTGLVFNVSDIDNPDLVSAAVSGTTLTLSFLQDAYGEANVAIGVEDADGESTQLWFAVMVNPVNDPPTFEAIPNVSVDEEEEVTVFVFATDVDGDELTYSLDSGPASAEVSASGIFRWTPDEVDGPGTHTMTVRVSDPSGASDTKSFQVTVNEVNLPPMLSAIGNVTLDEDQTETILLDATDPDIPANTLTFTLDAGAPSWAAITGNQLTLTPAYDDGGKIHNLVVRVSDGGSPTYSYSRLLAVIVNDVNRPPVLETMAATYSVNEGDTVTFTAIACDLDVEDATSLRFSLSGAPAAATIDPVTGQFSWITAEADGPGTFSFNVVVWDNHRLSAPLSDQQEITVTVDEVNQSPNIQVSGATTVDEHQEVVLKIRGNDVDLPANTLTLSLANVDPDITDYSFDPATGEFRWTPGEQHGGGSYQFTGVVNDNASPTPATTQQTVTITVNEVNSPPIIVPLAMSPFDAQEDITVEITGDPDTQTISFTAAATDPDIPVQSLTFSLAGVPAGTTNAPAITTTGDFSWTLTEDDGPATYNVTLRVTDSGGLTDERTFRVAVAVPRPTIYVNDVTVIEGGTAQFTVSLNKPGLTPVTVDFTTNDGTATAADDYVAAFGSLTFAPGETTKTIDVTTTTDTIEEVDKAFSVDLSNASGGDIDRAQGAGIIIDDDPFSSGWFTYGEASVTGNVVTVGVADRGEYDSQPYEFHGASVLLSPGANYTIAFDVDLATWDSYNELVDNATGYWDSFSVSVTPQPYPDLTLEDPVSFPFMWGGADYGTGTLETYTASASFTVAGDPNGPNYLNVVMDTITPPSADGAFPSWGTVIITQMPALAEPQLSIQSATVRERNGMAYFVVRRTGDYSGVSSVDFDTVDDSALAAEDYIATSGSLTFAAGEIVKLIAVPIINDKLAESVETFTVELSGVAGATLAISSAIGTIEDDDPEMSGQLIYPPIAHDDGIDSGGAYQYTVGHLETLDSSGSVLGNDVYYDSQQTFILASGTSHGALTLDPDTGSFTYDPDDSFAGIDTFTYKFIDGSLHSNVATVTIQVTNNLPVAEDDLFRVIVGGTLDISAANGLLVNDWDTDSGAPLTVGAYSSTTGSPLGVLTVNPDGSLTYQANAAGVDEYLYYVYDGINNSAMPATLVINVLGVQVNIAADSNHDGGIDEADELVEEDEPGRLVVLNGDLVDVVLKREFLDELNEATLGELDLTAAELANFYLTLGASGDGEVKLWADSSKTLAIPFGDYTYDGSDTRPKNGSVELPDTVYAEGTKRGQVAIELIFGSPSASSLASDWLRMTVFDVDLDIDSFNDDGLSIPGDDPAEDEIEADSEFPGKFIGVNDADRDLDGIPDYADGYDLDSVPGNNDNALDGGAIFTPLVVRVANKLNPAMATLTFTYDAGVPGLIGREGITYDTHAEDVYGLPSGQMRIWTAEGIRNKQDLLAGGQFVSPGQAYRLDDFSSLISVGDQFVITLYVEGLRPSAAIAGDQISVELNPLGANATAFSPLHSDSVNTTIVAIDADVDSDNNNGLFLPDRSQWEDQIEQLLPGKEVLISDDPAEFTPYVVEIPAPVDFESAFLEFDFDPSLIKLWTTSLVELFPGTSYELTNPALGFNGGRYTTLGIEGLNALGPNGPTTIAAVLRIIPAVGNAFLQADETKVAAKKEITSIKFLKSDEIADWTGIAVADVQRYGKLDPNTNPNGDLTDVNNLSNRGAFKESSFQGGDRFFPDAVITVPGLTPAVASLIGRNVVRVRVEVKGAEIGQPIWFRSFDVDDPSDDNYVFKDHRKYIDTDAVVGTKKLPNDNRGRLASPHTAAPSVTPLATGTSLDGAGILRAVNSGNTLGGWGANGKAVKALVKPLTNALGQPIDKDGNVVAEINQAQLIAEVDLATTFAPGDNFRIGAIFQPAAMSDADFELKMNAIPPNIILTQGAPEFPDGKEWNFWPDYFRLTGQLAVWRHLHFEDDTTVNLRGQMSPTTNRQGNRFADAFIEPEYLQINGGGGAPGVNATTLPPLPVTLDPITGEVSQNGEDALWTSRDSKNLDQPTFWVVYIGDTYTKINLDPIWGFAVNATSDPNNATGTNAFQASVIFRAQLEGGLLIAQAPALQREGSEKVAVHEVAHQILTLGANGLDKNGHRGKSANIDNYLNLGQPAVASWFDTINIMNEVPYYVPGALGVGTIDVFYFHPRDVEAMRRMTKSP
jgi:hypothetical protein